MKWLRRIGFLLHRDELAEELRVHQQMRADAGEPARGFGCDLALRERSREVWGALWLEQLGQDLRLSARQFRRAPGYAGLAIAVLALGIGVNTALFSVVDAVLLRPLPYPHAEQLVQVGTNTAAETLVVSQKELTGRTAAWVDHVPAFSGLALSREGEINLSGGAGLPERAHAAEVSRNFFDIAEVPPRGRGFIPGVAHQIVLSATTAKHFGLFPGGTIDVNGAPYRVAGVEGDDFQLPDMVAAWIPLPADWRMSADPLSARFVYFAVLARLRPGATRAQARRQVMAATGLANAGPPDVTVTPLLQADTAGTARELWLLLGAVGLVLLIACANVANLQLTHALQRSGETRMRVALGATRDRLARQNLAESLALAAAGGVAGCVLAGLCLPLLGRVLPVSVPLNGPLRLDARVLGFSLATALAATVLISVLPLLLALWRLPQTVLPGRGVMLTDAESRAHRAGWLRGALAVSEIALALILLAGAGLLLKSLVRLASVNRNFDDAGVLTAKLDLAGARYQSDGARSLLYRRLRARLAALPGVTSAALGNNLPFNLGSFFEVNVAQGGRWEASLLSDVSPGYFTTLRTPLLAGRSFTDADGKGSPKVVIVNQTLAERLWPHQPAVGQRLDLSALFENASSKYTVVGEVADVDLGTHEQPGNLYFPLAQSPSGDTAILMRTSGDPAAMAEPLRRAVAGLDATLPASEITPLATLVRKHLADPAFRSLLLGLFALLALGLSVAGLAGVMACSVSLRTHEIGVRMALGAKPAGIGRMVLAQTARLAALGLALGLAGTVALAHLLRHFLFEVSALDPATLAAAVAILAVAALAAGWLPAQRAARADPLAALRCE